MPKMLKDLAVKTGEYQNQAGETKGRWLNIGRLMQSDDGNSTFIILNRTFNPAGLPNPEHRDSILISLFDPKTTHQSLTGQAPPPTQTPQAPLDDAIPF